MKCLVLVPGRKPDESPTIAAAFEAALLLLNAPSMKTSVAQIAIVTSRHTEQQPEILDLLELRRLSQLPPL